MEGGRREDTLLGYEMDFLSPNKAIIYMNNYNYTYVITAVPKVNRIAFYAN
jgi:hypothetical protein